MENKEEEIIKYAEELLALLKDEKESKSMKKITVNILFAVGQKLGKVIKGNASVLFKEYICLGFHLICGKVP